MTAPLSDPASPIWRYGLFALTVAALGIATAAFVTRPDPAQTQAVLDPKNIKRILQDDPDILRTVLLENPTMVIEAIDRFRMAEQERQIAAAQQAAQVNLPTLLASPAVFTAGNPAGDVTVVEFFDYNCSFCEASLPVIMKALESDPDLRFVMVEMPILSASSVTAASAAIAARAQGKYLAFHQALMETPEDLTADVILQVAEATGLDIERLVEDMQSEETQRTLERNREFGTQFLVSGTPTFIVNGEVYSGFVPEPQFMAAIAAARKSGSASADRVTVDSPAG